MPIIPKVKGPTNLIQALEPHTRSRSRYMGGLNKLMKFIGGETPGPTFGGEDVQSDPASEAMGLGGPMMTLGPEIADKLARRGLARLVDSLTSYIPRSGPGAKTSGEILQEGVNPRAPVDQFRGLMQKSLEPELLHNERGLVDKLRTPRNLRLERGLQREPGTRESVPTTPAESAGLTVSEGRRASEGINVRPTQEADPSFPPEIDDPGAWEAFVRWARRGGREEEELLRLSGEDLHDAFTEFLSSLSP